MAAASGRSSSQARSSGTKAPSERAVKRHDAHDITGWFAATSSADPDTVQCAIPDQRGGNRLQRASVLHQQREHVGVGFRQPVSHAVGQGWISLEEFAQVARLRATEPEQVRFRPSEPEAHQGSCRRQGGITRDRCPPSRPRPR